MPSSVYTAVIAALKTTIRTVTQGNVSDSFFSDDWTCCSRMCDPSNPTSILSKFPSISFSLAITENVDSKVTDTITVTIPPEYIWRPVLVSTDLGGVMSCRVFGISEGSITLLGDVFMDGLLTVHDRTTKRVGFAIADNCPNGVKSKKVLRNGFLDRSKAASKSMCDCLSPSDKKSNLISSYWPFRSNKCFFWQWWMYIVIICLVVLLISFGVLAYIHLKQIALARELRAINQDQTQHPVTSGTHSPRNNFSFDLTLIPSFIRSIG